MITRTDLQTPNSQTDFDAALNQSPHDAVQDIAMDQIEFQYVDTTYPPSDVSEESELDLQFQQNYSSNVLKHEIDDMLSTASPEPHHMNFNSLCAPEGINYHEVMKKVLLSSERCRSPINLDKLTSSLHDELDELTYSEPPTPISEPSFMSSNEYSSQLSHIDAYSDDSEPAKPTCLERRNYDTSALMYGTDDMTFSGLVNCNDVLKTYKQKGQREAQSDTIVCCYRSYSSDSTDGETRESVAETTKIKREENFSFVETHPEENKKGKISGLQRQALDTIFSVTDRPSRGLVFHIAGELRLHHITVKNFFSNGRRRLRRAAARLNDPERTRRENQRRKEKRRLAALAAAASMPNGDRGNGSLRYGGGDCDPQASRDPPVLSPERRALMEKLAVKVQRSVAQKGLAAANLGEAFAKCSSYVNATTTATWHQPQNQTTALEAPIIPTQLHSNFLTSVEALECYSVEAPKTYEPQPIEEIYQHSNEEEFASMFSCSESDAVSSYNSSPDQNFSVYTPVEQENSPYVQMKQEEEGPYSPTSWQTLLLS